MGEKLSVLVGGRGADSTRPTLTAAQMQQAGADLLQFYKDTLAHKSVTTDTSKLASDVSALDLMQADLGRLLEHTLTSATLTNVLATMVSADADDLLRLHAGQGASQALTVTAQKFKLTQKTNRASEWDDVLS